MNALRRWRTGEGLTQQQAADKCGVSQSTFSRAEAGDPTLTVVNARQIAAGTDGNVKWYEIYERADGSTGDLPSADSAPGPSEGDADGAEDTHVTLR